MKKVIRGLAFCILLVFILERTYHILSWKDTTGGYLSSTQQLYATGDNLIDVVFMGSSHCYCGINPALLWDQYGMAAFDMSVSGQDKFSTYHTLVETLKTQSPSVVCIDAYALLYDRGGVLGNDYRNMLSMKLSSNSISLVQEYVAEEEQMNYLLRWPILHTRYKELDKYDFIQYQPSIYGRGYFFSDHIGSAYGPEANALACTEQEPLSELNQEWLDKLIALSKEENFQLIFWVIPFAASADDQEILNGAEAYLEQNDIPFLDFNKLVPDLGLDYNTDFSDAFHLNYRGADKLTAYVGEYLSDRYALADHRGNDDYYLWEQNSVYDAQLHNAASLSSQPDVSSLLAALAASPNLTVVLSLDGAYGDSSLDLQGALAAFNISEEEYNLGGKWVFSDGVLLYHMNQDAADTYALDVSDTDTLVIQNQISPDNGGTLGVSIMLNTTPVQTTNCGLTVVAYDNFQETLIVEKTYF